VIDGLLHSIGDAVRDLWPVGSLRTGGFVRGYAAIILTGAFDLDRSLRLREHFALIIMRTCLPILILVRSRAHCDSCLQHYARDIVKTLQMDCTAYNGRHISLSLMLLTGTGAGTAEFSLKRN